MVDATADAAAANALVTAQDAVTGTALTDFSNDSDRYDDAVAGLAAGSDLAAMDAGDVTGLAGGTYDQDGDGDFVRTTLICRTPDQQRLTI